MGIRPRLSIMMALAYAVQGAWWPLLSLHLTDLGVSGRGRGWIFATLAIGAMVSPPLAGRIADRRLAAQKLLALLYGIGSLLLAAMALGVFRGFAGLFPLFLIYWLIVAPYLGLISTIAMRNLERPREQFGGVRLWGTAGWMGVGWVVSAVMIGRGGTAPRAGAHEAFAVASALAALLALYALTLPNTPPLASGGRGKPVGRLDDALKRPGMLCLLLVGLGVSLTTPFVNQAVPVYLREQVGMPRERIAWAMSLGQGLEILALSLLPRVIALLGRKGTMVAGIATWVVYHGVFAMGPGLIAALAAISLNGVAIALFHVAAPLYLDSQAPADRRAGVQGMWVMMTTGLGALIGGLLAGEVMEAATGRWSMVFAVPAGIASTMLVVFLVAFRPRAEGVTAVAVSRPPRPLGAGGAALGASYSPRASEP